MSRSAGQRIAVLAFAVAMLGTTLPTPLYGLYRARFHFSQLTVTVVFATYAVGVIAALLLLGRLSDDVGRVRALLAGLAFSAASAVLFLVTQGLAPILAGRFLSGLSAGIFTGTATATIVDLAPEGESDAATLRATLANMGGLGSGPLLAGILAQVAPDELRLVFIVNLALIALAAAGLTRVPETVSEPPGLRLAVQPLRVGDEVRAVFVRAVLAGFAGFAVLGLFTAVAPAFMTQLAGVTSLIVVGAVVFAVFGASVAGQTSVPRVGERRAMVGGCAVLIAGLALLAAGLAAESLALLIAGGVVSGLGQGASFRAGLAAVTGKSPPADRAAVSSAYFVVCYVAISLPVVGVGALAQASTLKTAGLVFVAVVAAIAATALALLRRGSTT